MMKNTPHELCPVCGNSAKMRRIKSADLSQIECERCGNYKISGSTLPILGDAHVSNDGLLDNDTKTAAVGCWLRVQQRFGEWPILTLLKVKKLANNPYFPTVGEQLELLLELIGDTAKSIGVLVSLSGHKDQYMYGGSSPSSLKALVYHLDESGFLQTESSYGSSGDHIFTVSLTVRGWLQYEDIKRGITTGRNAFMAMPFNKPDLEDAWLPAVRDAVAETGFALKRVDDDPKSGLIDTRMRLQIKASRFLIVELTHANNGAYWEGGLAEGFGKPVIYTCRKGENPHFDVEHSFRIVWDPKNIEPALRTLKATIRNTLPDASHEPD